MHQVYLGLGTNLGDRRKNIEKAIELIDKRVGAVKRCSSFLETEPWGFYSENRFLNAVILCETEKTPREVLGLTQQIERELGRTQKSKLANRAYEANGAYETYEANGPAYADRPIDIDILLFDQLTVDEPDLKIPHPLMKEREFVMKPLGEILDR